MRKLLMLLIVFAFAAGSAMAQSSNLNDFFDSQHKKKGITQINLNADIAISSEDSKSDIKGLKVLAFDSDEAELNCKEFMAGAFKALEADGYVQIMSVDQENEKMSMYLLNDKDGKNSGTAFAVTSDDEVVITWIDGTIDFSEMANMMGNMDLDINIDGFDIDGE